MKFKEEGLDIKELVIDRLADELADAFNLPHLEMCADLNQYTIAELGRMKPIELARIFDDCFGEFTKDENEKLVEVDINEDGTSVRYAEEVADDLADMFFTILHS